MSLPPRHFNWRIRGNSLTWAFNHRAQLAQHYDLLIATSMVDLSALRGFVPSLAQIPTLVYFHENQFGYPASGDQFVSVEPQMITLYTALCADAIIFNSECNRTTFLSGVNDLLRRLPDQVPTGLPDVLRSRSRILPVPLAENWFEPAPKKAKPLTIIWNHRWEYDKGPDRLLDMLKNYFDQLPHNPSPFVLHMVGQQFRQQPAVFGEIKLLLEAHGALGQWGFVESAEQYRALLRESHIVLSTALHDFQGLAVLEAVAAGCVPLVPRRQAYPEWFGADYCYASNLENPEQEAQAMADALQKLTVDFAQQKLIAAPDIRNLSWTRLARAYQTLLDEFGLT